MMRHLKLPLIVTAIVLVIALVSGIGIVTWIHRSPISNAEKKARAEKLGAGWAVCTALLIAPWWFSAAARIGKERRASTGATGG